MNFKEKYTTDEKMLKEEKDPEVKDKIEKTKTILSNDAYAVGEVLEQSNISILNLVRSLAK